LIPSGPIAEIFMKYSRCIRGQTRSIKYFLKNNVLLKTPQRWIVTSTVHHNFAAFFNLHFY
jgi:hypothetical protein